jgi:hypothetical protein
MKKCWFCTEMIDDHTPVCPWCGRRQKDTVSNKKSESSQKSDTKSKRIHITDELIDQFEDEITRMSHSSNQPEPDKDKRRSPITEICQLEFQPAHDIFNSKIVWCQAVKHTPQGKVIIYKGPEFKNEYAKATNSWMQTLFDTFVSSSETDKLLRNLIQKLDDARSFVVSNLLADGWEPITFNDQGQIIAMKRVR